MAGWTTGREDMRMMCLCENYGMSYIRYVWPCSRYDIEPYTNIPFIRFVILLMQDKNYINLLPEVKNHGMLAVTRSLNRVFLAQCMEEEGERYSWGFLAKVAGE